MSEDSPCVGCRFAEWSKTATGRIKRKVSGRCTVEIPAPVLPICVEQPRLIKRGIWSDYSYAANCPLREPEDV